MIYSHSAEPSCGGGRPLLDLLLSRDVQLVQVVHGGSVLENLCNLDAGRDELENVAVVLERAALVLGGVAHLERVLEDGDKLLDLTVVQHPGWDPPLRRQPLEQVHPFGPLAILGPLDGPHVLRQRDRELVLCHKVVCALRQTVVDLGQDTILFLHQQIRREVGELPLLHGNVFRWGALQKLMGPIKLIPV